MLKMNLRRAQELIEPLKKGKANGISKAWQERLIEALEYVIEHEQGKKVTYETPPESLKYYDLTKGKKNESNN